eukprot:Gregarina_sp_Poly_1__541@NODE_112_length_13900_cov_236_895034_g99_i0_p4_GENE_NODE_112_length_13900_cov_236_895034_g99_i0NODE_112_length_13900_cov_236_895034_g99_i0_p4_ORF_typecomplete_len438_score36_41DHHC/PF01529_20/4_2e02DHHC/PF01529_20/4_8e42TRP/PF06011_12/0_77TRP/PF06011_12/32_NODE_112_length_13900_cov_236_895034_g99_i0883510148
MPSMTPFVDSQKSASEATVLAERQLIREQLLFRTMTEEEFPKGKGQTELKRSKVGKVRYIFGGRCVIGPDIRLATVAFLLILVPSIIYNGWSLPWIVQRWNGAWLLVIFTVVIEAIVIALFMRTAMSDPGIVPREADLWGLDAPWLNQLMPKNPPKHQDIVIHGHLLKMKYCISCNFYRPPRCVHCSVCDNCVDKFDHHCPWVGNCVGRRNYRSFLLFVFSTSIYILTVMITSPIKFFQCLQEFNQDNDFRGAMKLVWPEAWDSVVLTLFSFGFLWFVLGLAGYHFYLISSNQTTYEQIKGFFEEKLNPWDRGLARNLTELLCRRRRPKFTFRPRVPVVYSRFQHIKIGMTGRIEEGGILKMKLPISTVDAKTGLPPTSIQEKIERIQVEHTIVHGADRDGDSISSHRSSSAELLSVMSAEDVVEGEILIGMIVTFC